MPATLLSLLVLVLVAGGLCTHHLHHGVEQASSWHDTWLVHLTQDTQPQVSAILYVDFRYPLKNE